MKSTGEILRFGEFTLDPANRRLSRGSQPVEIGGRYLDALVMLASAPGQLISKDRLHDEVWRGVPVTDEALSQAIMALRKALGDNAAHPRYIETVPRHGYRFVGDVTIPSAPTVAIPVTAAMAAPTLASLPGGGRIELVTRGIIGAVAAGLLVGLLYGTLAAGSGAGSAFSLVLVLLAVCVLSALVSGLGIAGGIGIALGAGRPTWWRPVLGGALGGLLMGGFARLLGLDTLRLLMGHAPERMAGAPEGALAGAVVGFAVWLITNHPRMRSYALVVALGGMAGLVLTIAGGTLMAGSLAALVSRFPEAGLSMAWARDPMLMALSGAFEAAAFVALVSAAMAAQKR